MSRRMDDHAVSLQKSHMVYLTFYFENFFSSGFLHNTHSMRLGVFSGIIALLKGKIILKQAGTSMGCLFLSASDQ